MKFQNKKYEQKNPKSLWGCDKKTAFQTLVDWSQMHNLETRSKWSNAFKIFRQNYLQPGMYSSWTVFLVKMTYHLEIWLIKYKDKTKTYSKVNGPPNLPLRAQLEAILHQVKEDTKKEKN